MAKEEIKQTENNHDLEDKSSEVKVDKKEEDLKKNEKMLLSMGALHLQKKL